MWKAMTLFPKKNRGEKTKRGEMKYNRVFSGVVVGGQWFLDSAAGV